MIILYEAIVNKCAWWYNMNRDRTSNHDTNEGGEEMAVLAKPVNKISVIKEKDSQKFVREFNKNKITEEFLESCKKATSMFARKR